MNEERTVEALKCENEHDIQSLQRAGRIARETIETMQQQARPGMSTQQLDDIGLQVMEKQGARSAPRLVYDFPGATCISVNEEVAHGIPGQRLLKAGDVINVDVSLELDGYFVDSGATFYLEPVADPIERVCQCSKNALAAAIRRAQTGNALHTIGKAVQEVADQAGFSIIKNLCGHGVGRSLHEAPHYIFMYDYLAEPLLEVEAEDIVLESGMVLALETFISTNEEFVGQANDGWTLKTEAGSIVAQYEHTVIVTDTEPIIVTGR